MTIPDMSHAQLNVAGLISDRWLYLAKDEFTVVEKGASDAGYLLAPPDTLIPAADVARLGLEISGGKIVQKKEGAKGGPSAGPTPQSASEPPSKPVVSAAPAVGIMAGFDPKSDVKAERVYGPETDPRTGLPKSDPRFQSNSGSKPPAEEARAEPKSAPKAASKPSSPGLTVVKTEPLSKVRSAKKRG